jgi:hypothetical protein
MGRKGGRRTNALFVWNSAEVEVPGYSVVVSKVLMGRE